jgi:hypothetical protein
MIKKNKRGEEEEETLTEEEVMCREKQPFISTLSLSIPPLFFLPAL